MAGLCHFGPSGNGAEVYSTRSIIAKVESADALKSLREYRVTSGGERPMRTISAELKLYEVGLLGGESVQPFIYELAQSGLVKFAEPDYWLEKHAAPNDPEFLEGTQWGLWNFGQAGGLAGSDIGAVEAWEVRAQATNVVVAVIDTGVRYTHEDLRGNIWRNPREIAGNELDDDGNGYVDDVVGIYPAKLSVQPLDDEGHGTHIAGIIGAVGNNGLGVSGVNWGVQIMALRLFDEFGNGRYSDAIRCLDYARLNGAQIINASWGNTNTSEGLRLAFEALRAAGVLVAVSAGNSSLDLDVTPVYPASFDFENIVVVSSSNRRDEFPWMSANYGQVSVDLVAPGEAIYSCWSSAEDAYAFNSGTSMAAPMVAGSLALLKAEFPEETPIELKARVMRTVDRSREFAEVCVSGGRLNLGRAMREWIQLSVAREGEELVIEFAGRAGKKYVVEATSDFSSWETVESITASSNGMLRSEHAAVEGARFFRVRLD